MSSSYLIEFNNYDHSFCEATIYSNGAEYINSITALFISFIGLFGLYYNTTDINSSMMYYSLVLNGITSCAYHHTHYIGWGLLDRYSMVFVAAYCYNVFINLIIKDYPFISHLLRFLIVSYLTVLSTFTGLHNEFMFNMLFGVFLTSVIMFIISLSYIYKLNKIVFIYGAKGIILISIGGISWIVTENLCYEYNIIKYLMGHSLWHIAVSLGGYYISLIPLLNGCNLDFKYNIPYAVKN
jgi:hypothetical protein